MLRGGRQKLQPRLVPTVPDGFDPTNRCCAFEGRAIRVLDAILGQEEGDGHYFSNREGPCERDRSATTAQIHRLRMQRLTRDGELARDAYRMAIVPALLVRILRHTFMMRKTTRNARLPVSLNLRTPRPRTHTNVGCFRAQVAVARRTPEQPSVDGE